ncbi:MAG: hypothetical protein WDZ91_13875 [Paenibacillaceae bacterium]
MDYLDSLQKISELLKQIDTKNTKFINQYLYPVKLIGHIGLKTQLVDWMNTSIKDFIESIGLSFYFANAT